MTRNIMLHDKCPIPFHFLKRDTSFSNLQFLNHRQHTHIAKKRHCIFQACLSKCCICCRCFLWNSIFSFSDKFLLNFIPLPLPSKYQSCVLPPQTIIPIYLYLLCLKIFKDGIVFHLSWHFKWKARSWYNAVLCIVSFCDTSWRGESSRKYYQVAKHILKQI